MTIRGKFNHNLEIPTMAAPANAALNANAAAAKSAAPTAQIVRKDDIGVKTAPVRSAFDYGTEAELFHARSRTARRQPVGYRRFTKAAEAIRFAIEELAPELLLGSVLEVDEKRYDSHGIRRLYGSADYPLARRKAA
jgi:hypothetical protein